MTLKMSTVEWLRKAVLHFRQAQEKNRIHVEMKNNMKKLRTDLSKPNKPPCFLHIQWFVFLPWRKTFSLSLSLLSPSLSLCFLTLCFSSLSLLSPSLSLCFLSLCFSSLSLSIPLSLSLSLSFFPFLFFSLFVSSHLLLEFNSSFGWSTEENGVCHLFLRCQLHEGTE